MGKKERGEIMFGSPIKKSRGTFIMEANRGLPPPTNHHVDSGIGDYSHRSFLPDINIEFSDVYSS